VPRKKRIMHPPKRVARERSTDTNQRAFIAAYTHCASVSESARIVGLDRKQHYEWLKADPRYRAAFEAEADQAAQSLEDEAVRRALDGVRRPMYYRGKPVRSGRGRASRPVYEVEYSDQLLVLLLKRFRPQLYREHTVTEVSGSLDLVNQIEAGRRRVLEMRAKEQTG